MSFAIGDIIGGRYEVRRIFGGAGRSGMGIVLACLDRQAGGALALKTYQQGFYDNKGLVDSFKRGALAWIHLERHPAIVQAYGVHTLGDRLFLGLELIAPDAEDRNTLSHYLKEPLSPRQALLWTFHFCDAMEHARKKGITPHRDIKPDNLMVTAAGQLKVSDFDLAGLGKLAAPPKGGASVGDGQTPGLSFIDIGGGKFVAGTPPWMAPEQFAGEADSVSDIYSFGVVLYQMAEGGRLPIRPTDGDWGKAHATRLPVPLKSKLWPLIAPSLAKRREERFGGRDPAKAFVELREAAEKLWPRVAPDEPLPTPPTVDELAAHDYSDKGASLAQLGMHDQALAAYKKAIALDPAYPLVYLNAGVTLAKKGNLAEAKKAYKKALSLDGKLAEGYHNYGLCLDAEGDLAQAEAAFRKALHLKPTLSHAAESLTALLSRTGRDEESVAVIEKVVGLVPHSAHARYTYGVALEKTHRYAEAIVEYEAAIGLAPHRGDYRYALGNGWRLSGDMDQAMAAWFEAARLDPKHAMARFSIALTYERIGKKIEAYRWYKDATDADPTTPDPYYNLGLLLANATLFDEAALCFENFVRYLTPPLEPHREKAAGYVTDLRQRAEAQKGEEEQYVEAVYNRGHHLLNLGRYDEAKIWFEKALARKGDYASPHVGLGVVAERREDYATAEACYLKAAALAPGDPLPYNNLGWVNYLAGRPDQAMAYLEKYLSMKPDNAQAVANAEELIAKILAASLFPGGDAPSPAPAAPTKESHQQRAIRLYRDGRYDEALDAMRAALAEQPENPQYHNNLGLCYSAKGLYDHAFAAWNRAASLDPAYVEPKINMGVELTRADRVDEALRLFAGFIGGCRVGEAHLHHGQALEKAGRGEEAIDAYRRAIELSPGPALHHFRLATALKEAGRLDEAIEAYMATLARDENYLYAYFNLGLAWEGKRRWKEAADAYRAFAEMAPPSMGEALAYARQRIDDLKGKR